MLLTARTRNWSILAYSWDQILNFYHTSSVPFLSFKTTAFGKGNEEAHICWSNQMWPLGPVIGLIWNLGKPMLMELHSLDSTGQQGWRSQQTLPAVMHTIPDKQWRCRALHFLTSLSIQGEFKPGLLYVGSVIPGLVTLACPLVYSGIFCVPEFWSWEVNAFQGGVNLSNSLLLK